MRFEIWEHAHSLSFNAAEGVHTTLKYTVCAVDSAARSSAECLSLNSCEKRNEPESGLSSG